MSGDPELEALRIDRPARRFRRSGPSWFTVLFLISLAALVGLGLFQKPRVEAWLGDWGSAPVEIVVATRESRITAAAVKGMAANGHVVAARRAALSADTPGRIVELLVTEGSRVEAGERVARLFDEEYAAALARARAELVSAEAEVTRTEAGVHAAQTDLARRQAVTRAAEAAARAAESDLKLARVELERVQTLIAKRAVEVREVDRAAAARDKALATWERLRAEAAAAKADETHGDALVTSAQADETAARARVDVAKATVEQAQATLRKTEIRAPFSGVVVLKDAEVGEVVSPNVVGGSSSRGSVVTMVDQASLEVQAEVSETNITAVRVGGSVKVFLDADPARAYAGRVDRIWPTANRQKATIEVRITFLEPDDMLRPDMGVRAVFVPEGEDEPTPAKDEAGPRPIRIPDSALVRRGGKTGVFVVDRGRAAFREITVGGTRDGRIDVTGGLEEGDRVVVRVPETLEDGAAVTIEGA